MTSGAVITKNGFNAFLNRAFKSTPDNTVPSRFAIGTGSNTPSETDTGLQTQINAWNSGSNYKNYNSGYPSFDTANQQVTVQGFVPSSQANGNSIFEYADVNTDGTPVYCSRVVLPSAITKTSGVQIYFTNIYKRS